MAAAPILISLLPFLDQGRVVRLAADTPKAQVLRLLAERACSSPLVSDPAAFWKAICDREEVSCTGVGGGIAVPHAKLPSIKDFVITLGLCPAGLAYDAKDGAVVRIVVMIAAPPDDGRYLKVLATVAGRLRDPQVTAGILAAASDLDAVAHFAC